MSNNVSKLKQLRDKVFYTFAILAVFRVMSQVPTPGVDSSALKTFFDAAAGSVFGVFNNFTGGALERFSVLALGIMPYITSSIIFSLLVASFPSLQEMQKEQDGHKKIQQWTRYLTVVLCCFQGFGLAVGLESIKTQTATSIVLDPGLSFRLLTIITLMAGTMFVMWLGEQITERGIGNGISLIIFAGIAASIPSGIRDTITFYNNGELSLGSLAILGVIIYLAFWIIIYVETSFRKVPVQYAKRVVKNQVFGGQTSHLPMKINISGVMPPIFAYALMGFPTTILQFVSQDSAAFNFIQNIQASLSPGKMLYNVLFVILIFFFTDFYSKIQFKSDDIAESLKKNGGFIPGVRPGSQTKEFLDLIVSRLNYVGATYIAVICVLPTVLLDFVNVPFYFGGTSLLILVGVAIDTMLQAESFRISNAYDQAYKSKGKYKGINRKRF